MEISIPSQACGIRSLKEDIARETIVIKKQLTDLDVTLAEGQVLNDTRLEVDPGPTTTCTIITYLKELDADVAKLRA